MYLWLLIRIIKRKMREKREEEYKSIVMDEELTIEETQILKENTKWDKIAELR